MCGTLKGNIEDIFLGQQHADHEYQKDARIDGLQDGERRDAGTEIPAFGYQLHVSWTDP